MSAREFDRKSLAVDFTATLRVLGTSDRADIKEVKDLSFGGMKVVTSNETPLELESIVNITIILHDIKIKLNAAKMQKKC